MLGGWLPSLKPPNREIKEVLKTMYHHANSVSRDDCAQNPPGNEAGIAGSAGSPGLILETSSAQPPYTNRGADITIPLENRSLIDWLAFTCKLDDPQAVIEITGLAPALFTDSTIGISGYRKSYRRGNIAVYYAGREDMGCHVEISGQGCRQYEAHFLSNPWPDLFQTVLTNNGKFTRLDLAIDNIDGALSLPRFFSALQDPGQIRTLFGEWRRIVKGSFQKDALTTGETIYLGSAKSQVMFRIYNKAQETGSDGEWIRFELQLRDKRAHEAAKLLTSSKDIGPIATGIINNYFAIIDTNDSNISRCTLQPWWAEWLQSTEKISLATEKAVKYVDDSMEFIKRQYAPTLAMIKIHLGQQDYQQFITEIDRDGRERMSAKHEQILAASTGGRS